jgi:hypothetical protein
MSQRSKKNSSSRFNAAWFAIVREVALEVEELADLIQISHFNMRVVHLCECRLGWKFVIWEWCIGGVRCTIWMRWSESRRFMKTKKDNLICWRKQNLTRLSKVNSPSEKISRRTSQRLGNGLEVGAIKQTTSQVFRSLSPLFSRG